LKYLRCAWNALRWRSISAALWVLTYEREEARAK